MVHGLAASGCLGLALTSTPAARYIAADGVSSLRSDAQMTLELATAGGLNLGLTSTPAAHYVAADGDSNVRTDAQMALELA